MKPSEIKESWIFTKNIGATSYWFEETDDGTGDTIGPEEVLELGCQLEAELAGFERDNAELHGENAGLRKLLNINAYDDKTIDEWLRGLE